MRVDANPSAPLPTPLYRAEDVRALDRYAIEEVGIAGFELMQRAAQAAFRRLLQRWPLARNLVVLCGGGNNGGDGYLMASLAMQQGLGVRCIAVGDPGKLQGDARSAWAQTLELGLQPDLWSDLDDDRLCAILDEADLIVDAMLGTGLSGSVRAPYSDAIEAVNAAGKPVLAVDIPSGLSSDTGMSLGHTIKAGLTVTFIGLKQGLVTGVAPNYVGELQFDDLDVGPKPYAAVSSSARRIDWQLMAQHLPAREPASHKGHFGFVLVVGGDHGMGGAALMASEAVVRCGAGLVRLATRREHVVSALARCPDVMAAGVDHVNHLEPMLEGIDLVIVGPGLGRGAWGEQLLRRVLDWGGPCVIDADALNLLTTFDTPRQRDNWVLTPHPGEAGRLLGSDAGEVMQDRFAAVRALQSRWGGTIVLKGAGTLIQEASGPTQVATVGNPGMATGGMGDALSGLLGGLMAQKDLADVAVPMAVTLHGAAADEAARQVGYRGLTPQDLIAAVPRVLGRAEGVVCDDNDGV